MVYGYYASNIGFISHGKTLDILKISCEAQFPTSNTVRHLSEAAPFGQLYCVYADHIHAVPMF